MPFFEFSASFAAFPKLYSLIHSRRAHSMAVRILSVELVLISVNSFHHAAGVSTQLYYSYVALLAIVVFVNFTVSLSDSDELKMSTQIVLGFYFYSISFISLFFRSLVRLFVSESLLFQQLAAAYISKNINV